MTSIAFGLLAVGFVLLCIGLARMMAPRIDGFFESVSSCVASDVTINVGTEGGEE
jgi:hypothetical protein